MTYILGLTGSIATGKSTISRYFSQLGYPVVDADKGARVVVEPGQPLLEEIATIFGAQVLNPDGSLNRKVLGSIIFADADKRKQLDLLFKPHIRQWLRTEQNKLIQAGYPLIVLDIPLLFEGGYDQYCDGVMVVYVHPKQQVERLMTRDSINETQALQKINAQLAIEEKAERADYVIDNSLSIEESQAQVSDWLQKMNL